jgi:predicted ATPase
LRRTSRGTSTRHHTLRATVDWSYELLDVAEQQLFRRLAVFRGGFDLAAARAMGGSGTLDLLARLIDKSLVLAEQGPHGTRYRLLETLRQYAWERLHDANDVDFARSRHMAHFLGRAEALYTPVQGMGGPLRALDPEVENLRSAFEWCELTDPDAGLRLVAATGYLWWRRSAAEGRRWADLFLSRCPEPGALHAAGMLEMFSDPTRARCIEEASFAVAEHLGDRATAAIALAVAVSRRRRVRQSRHHESAQTLRSSVVQ